MNLFQQIEQDLPKWEGWCPADKAQILAAMVSSLKPKLCCEIGIWTGASFLPMALALKANGSGVILGIDSWSTDASVEGQINPEDQKFWGQQANHEQVYEGFMKRILDYDLHKFVQIVRRQSRQVNPPDNLDILHIDGNHGVEAESDIHRFTPKVRRGGFCILDDLNWAGGHVTTGAQWMTMSGWVELYKLGTGAVYQKIT